MLKRHLLKAAKFGIGLAAAASLFLSGCGGGGGSTPAAGTPATSTLNGVAAIGSPIVGGTISVSCASGSALTATTNSTGSWQVTLTNQTLPCAVEVSGGTINGTANPTPYHSIATAAGTVNVTPLTDLMVANLAGTATPGTWFTGLTPAQLAAITQAQVDASLVKLGAALSGLPIGANNPVTMTLNATPGTVGDNMLVALSAAMTSAGVTYPVLLGNASAPAFAPPAGLGSALTTAYAGATGGHTAGGSAIPAVPSGVSATASSATQINVNWINVTGATAYNIYRSTTTPVVVNPANKITPAIAQPTAGPFPNTGLTATTTYYYKVTALNAMGESIGSAEVSATTLAAGAATLPAAPFISSITSISTSQIDLYWFPVTGAASYNVYRATSPNVQIIAANKISSVTTAPLVTPYSDTGLAAATTYYYKVTSVNASGESVGSNEKMAQTILWSVAPTVIAGSTAVAGIVDSTGTAARFGAGINSVGMVGMVADAAGNLYLSDGDNYNIRKVTPAGVVTTFAGPDSATRTACQMGCQVYGNVDGTGTAARFWTPSGIAIDATGNLYVADTANHSIRKITPAGVVSTFAGGTAVNCGLGIASCAAGNLDGTGTAATFGSPVGIAIDAAGNLYVTDRANRNIRKITPAAVVTTLVGPDSAACTAAVGGTCPSGSANGTGLAARFNSPNDIAVDTTGNLYVSDRATGIRRVTPAGVVTTLVPASYGSVSGDSGLVVQDVGSIAIGATGNLYVADKFYANRIRIITSAGLVSTGAAFSNGDKVGAMTIIGNSLYMTVGGAAGVLASGTAVQMISGVAP